MKLIRSGAAVFLAAAVWAGQALAAAPQVEQAYVNAPPPGARVAAGFMVITNHAHHAMTLESVTSDAAARVEVHNTTHENGRMKMNHLKTLEIPSHGSVELKPGGMHLMLLELGEGLMPGDTVSFVLSFKGGAQVSIDAEVRDMRQAAERESSEHADHHHHH